jgi:hypothetical protein
MFRGIDHARDVTHQQQMRKGLGITTVFRRVSCEALPSLTSRYVAREKLWIRARQIFKEKKLLDKSAES